MSGIILAGLFLAGLAAFVWASIRSPDKDKPDKGKADRWWVPTREAPARPGQGSTPKPKQLPKDESKPAPKPAPKPVLRPVSEARIARESRELIQEIERFLSDRKAS